jgi:hypothetical protein
MKVIITAVASSSRAKKLEAAKRISFGFGAFQLPPGAGTDVDYWQPMPEDHPRSCWPGALLESAQNAAWRCPRSYWVHSASWPLTR